MQEIQVIWHGSQFVPTSLSLVNREYCSLLLELENIDLYLMPNEVDQFSIKNNPTWEKLKSFEIGNKTFSPREDIPAVWISHVYPPEEKRPPKGYWIVIQPWEYSKVVAEWVSRFNLADEIWTPSHFSRQAFIDSGIERVHVIPNGIKPEIFRPQGKIMNLPTNKQFKFLFVGGTLLRKGIDALLKSYAQAFKKEDDVCLVIKDFGTGFIYKGQTFQNEITRFQSDPKNPEIIYLNENLSEEGLAELYRACDVFVSPYRGEGFSLPTLEAMACGLPVIVSQGGATEDFVDEKVGWKIQTQKLPVSHYGKRPLLEGAYFLNPNEEHLADLLRYAYRNQNELILKGVQAVIKAHSQWTWKHAALKLLQRIDFISDTHLAGVASEQWTETSLATSEIALLLKKKYGMKKNGQISS